MLTLQREVLSCVRIRWIFGYGALWIKASTLLYPVLNCTTDLLERFSTCNITIKLYSAQIFCPAKVGLMRVKGSLLCFLGLLRKGVVKQHAVFLSEPLL